MWSRPEIRGRCSLPVGAVMWGLGFFSTRKGQFLYKISWRCRSRSATQRPTTTRSRNENFACEFRVKRRVFVCLRLETGSSGLLDVESSIHTSLVSVPAVGSVYSGPTMVLAPLTVCIEPRMPPRAPRGWKRESNPKPVAQKFRTPERRSASGLKRPTILAIYESIYIVGAI